MRTVKSMQINLLDFKLAEKRACQHLLKIISVYSLMVIILLTTFYLLYSQAMGEKKQAEATFERLQMEQTQLLKGAAISDDSQYMIRQKTVQQFDPGQTSAVPQLNIIYSVGGTDISLAKITVEGDEIAIAADAQNAEGVKIYIEELNDSGYFEPVKEFKIEKNAVNKEVEFSLKLSRRHYDAK